MAYFQSSFNTFFKDLSKNNNSEWFNNNRKRYEKDVKKPFQDFVHDMITKIQLFETDIKIKPSEAIMRINKDIRFSKDKTPYNTHVSANISLYGKKDKSYPGFYFQMSHEKILIVGGVYMVDNIQLQKIRNHIASNLNEFSKIYSNKNFVEKYKTLQGEQSKRLPSDIKAIAKKEPLIANKQFYYSSQLKSSIVTSEGLSDFLMEYYLAGSKMNEFLKRALV